MFPPINLVSLYSGSSIILMHIKWVSIQWQYNNHPLGGNIVLKLLVHIKCYKKEYGHQKEEKKWGKRTPVHFTTGKQMYTKTHSKYHEKKLLIIKEDTWKYVRERGTSAGSVECLADGCWGNSDGSEECLVPSMWTSLFWSDTFLAVLSVLYSCLDGASWDTASRNWCWWFRSRSEFFLTSEELLVGCLSFSGLLSRLDLFGLK